MLILNGDRVIISILDSSIDEYNVKYNNLFFKSLFYNNITDDVNDAENFVK